MKSTRKLITLGVLTTLSLTLFVLEAQIPPLTPYPGIKLGLANMITLFILYKKPYKAADAILVVTARVLLASFITGNISLLIFSFSGGSAAVLAMLIIRKVLPPAASPVPVTSVAGAISHNITQIAVAASVYGNSGIWLYLPVLVFGGILSGLLTGFAVLIIIKRI